MAAPSPAPRSPLGAATCFEQPLEARCAAARRLPLRMAAAEALRGAPQPTHRLSIAFTALCCLLSVLPFVPQYAKFIMRRAPGALRARAAPTTPARRAQP